MSDVSQNPSFHLSKPPHKLSNKHVVLKNKPTKKSSTKSRNKNNIINNNNNNNNNNLMMLNNNNNNNNRPLKVVHISNPMKFQVAAAEFRALVQGLTGRDAVVEWPIDHESEVVGPATNDDSTDGGNNSTDDQSNEVNCNQQDDHQEDEVVNNFSACFGPSDHHLMSFDYFGNHFNVDDVELYGCYGGSDLRAFMGDDGQ